MSKAIDQFITEAYIPLLDLKRDICEIIFENPHKNCTMAQICDRVKYLASLEDKLENNEDSRLEQWVKNTIS
jgi:ppGpp synthetase/RelA/SpoT-type nucleotidyltranferase